MRSSRSRRPDHFSHQRLSPTPPRGLWAASAVSPAPDAAGGADAADVRVCPFCLFRRLPYLILPHAPLGCDLLTPHGTRAALKCPPSPAQPIVVVTGHLYYVR